MGNVARIKQAKNKSRGSHCGLFYGFLDCPSQNNQGNVDKSLSLRPVQTFWYMASFLSGWMCSQDTLTINTRSQFLADQPGYCGLQRYYENVCRSIIPSVDQLPQHKRQATLLAEVRQMAAGVSQVTWLSPHHSSDPLVHQIMNLPCHAAGFGFRLAHLRTCSGTWPVDKSLLSNHSFVASQSKL